MIARHPETAIAPYVAGDLPAAERAEIAAHLDVCPACRETADAFRAVLDELALTAPAPPLDAARYAAELRRKLVVRVADRAVPRPAWRWRPVPLALSAALASVLVFLAVKGVVLDTRVAELSVVDETVLGERLDLVRQYPMLETIELLEEDLDVIRHLDRLADVREGSTPSPRDG